MAGTLLSVWAHLVAIFGWDPHLRVQNSWIVQLVLFGLLVPVIAELFLYRDTDHLLRSPRWMKRALYVLLAYYGLNFYIFLYWSVDHLSSRYTWQMFSSGWLLLFALAAVFYQVRFVEVNRYLRMH
jgi:hypothetical protein